MAKSKSATDMQFSNLFSQVDGRRQVDGGSTLRRKKPYLTDNIKLGREFRKHYVRGLKRLLRQGKLKLGGSVDFLKNTHQRHAWLEGLEATDWNVFIQGPPHGRSDPTQVVKYLAGYLTGGPIADGRIISADENEVYFWARPKHADGVKHKGMNRPRPHRLIGRQFMQRWTQHILPKGFTRSRSYGGYHGSKRARYLQQSRDLLGQCEEVPIEPDENEEGDPTSDRTCPYCEGELELIHSERRPSWRKIFERDIYRSTIYSPQHPLVKVAPHHDDSPVS
jgi:hypothetical protein